MHGCYNKVVQVINTHPLDHWRKVGYMQYQKQKLDYISLTDTHPKRQILTDYKMSSGWQNSTQLKTQ